MEGRLPVTSCVTPVDRSGSETAHDSYDNLTDAELAGLAKLGNRFAFGILWSRHHAESLVIARGITRNEQDAHDVVQDAWLNAWTHVPTLNVDANFPGWMARIVRNQSLIRLRSPWRRRASPLETSPAWSQHLPGRNPEQSCEWGETIRVLRGVLAKLPKPYRDPLEAIYLEGRSLRSVAGQLSITEPALKSRMHRARTELRLRFSERLDTRAAIPDRLPVQES